MTRRTRPTRPVIVAVAALVAVLASLAVSSPAPAQLVDDARPAVKRKAVEELRLGCTAAIVGDERGVVCRWTESTRDGLRGYQLYRIVNGSARQLVATVGAEEQTSAFDAQVRSGDELVYGVVARDGAGRVIGLGGPVRLTFGR